MFTHLSTLACVPTHEKLSLILNNYNYDPTRVLVTLIVIKMNNCIYICSSELHVRKEYFEYIHKEYYGNMHACFG